MAVSSHGSGHPSRMIVCTVIFIVQIHIASSVLVGLKNQHHNISHTRSSIIEANQTRCELFKGTWVHDDTYPVYQSSACSIIDPQFNCQMFGRPDSDYLKYRWKPANCQLPRFDGAEFLIKMRGKSVMFVGDSLGRNQWESLICMILAAVPLSHTHFISGHPLSTFKFIEYGVAVEFYKAPYLVDIDEVEGENILKLENISRNGGAWKNADVLSFNTGHWWIHNGSLQGWDYMESEGMLYQDMDRLVALEKGLRTWANWVDTNVDKTRTRLFFQSVSPTHLNSSDWSACPTSKTCYGETSPISGTTYPGPEAYPGQMKVVDAVIRNMSNPVYLLDITMLSEMRKDAHPSIYNRNLSLQQRVHPDRYADCSHWCLPGLPDTWNQLFYTVLFFQ